MMDSIRRAFSWYLSYMMFAGWAIIVSALLLLAYAGWMTGHIGMWEIGAVLPIAGTGFYLLYERVKRKKNQEYAKAELLTVEIEVLRLMTQFVLLSTSEDPDYERLAKCKLRLRYHYEELRKLTDFKRQLLRRPGLVRQDYERVTHYLDMLRSTLAVQKTEPQRRERLRAL